MRLGLVAEKFHKSFLAELLLYTDSIKAVSLKFK